MSQHLYLSLRTFGKGSFNERKLHKARKINLLFPLWLRTPESSSPPKNHFSVTLTFIQAMLLFPVLFSVYFSNFFSEFTLTFSILERLGVILKFHFNRFLQIRILHQSEMCTSFQHLEQHYPKEISEMLWFISVLSNVWSSNIYGY